MWTVCSPLPLRSGGDELDDYLNINCQSLSQEIISGNYNPGAVKKVEIPKPQGGARMLGIPTVEDRLIQQAISQWLSQCYEPDFFSIQLRLRPNKNAHQAVLQAQGLFNEDIPTTGKDKLHRQHYSNKPPYAERHVRWCEGTGSQIMATLLLDSIRLTNC